MLRKLIFLILSICLISGCGESKEEKAKLEHEKCQLYIATMVDIITGVAKLKGLDRYITPKLYIDIKQCGDNYIAAQKVLMDTLVEKETEDINIINELNNNPPFPANSYNTMCKYENDYGWLKDDCNNYRQYKKNLEDWKNDLSWVQESENKLADWSPQWGDKVIEDAKK